MNTSRQKILKTEVEPRAFQWLLIGIVLVFLFIFLILPLAVVLIAALEKGGGVYLKSITDRDTMAAIRLTLLTAAFTVPMNLVFGVAAAWTIAKYEFAGKKI